MTALWTVRCTKSTKITFDTTASALNSANPPRPVTYSDTIQHTVSASKAYNDGILLPASWYVYHDCTTVSAYGVIIGSGCFNRPSTPTAPCGVESLGGLNPAWAFGCPGGSAKITVNVSYHYLRPGQPLIRTGHKQFTYSLAQGKAVEAGFTPPRNVTITDSVVRVVNTSNHKTLGTASFTR